MLETLVKELIRDEGVRLKPYRCTAGRLTIGVGHNLDAKGITDRAARVILEDDIAEVFSDLDARLPWWRKLTEPRQRVLANMCFNLGIAGLLSFKRTLALIESGQYLEAAQAMLASKWAKQVGPRAVRLAVLMRDG